ncbi:MAG: Gfo/Idh/MocA family protein [Geminicoccaceae bacterium]
MTPTSRTVLQAGFGGFGPTHLQAWLRKGFGRHLWIADPDPSARARAALHLPAERIVADYREVLEDADLVDVVAPTEEHVEICIAAIEAGKDVLVEKPLTLRVDEAQRLAEIVAASDRILQVGYYFRHHPLARYARDRVTRGDLGRLRYLSGNFYGLKRARGDIGVTANDAVHFLDLFNWLIGAAPVEVFAVQRDHFGRGLDDLSVILLTWPDGTLAKIEASYIQPGRQPDAVMPNALTTKTVEVCGSEGALEIDFQAERLIWHRVRHERRDDGLWHPVFGDAIVPKLEPRGAVEVVASQLTEFLDHVEHRTAPEADVRSCGVAMAVLLDAIALSARTNRPVSCQVGGPACPSPTPSVPLPSTRSRG